MSSVSDLMKCIDEPYTISGHYDSKTASNLMVVYEKCNPEKRKCKSKEFIEKAIEGSYMLLVDNSEHYSHHAVPGSEEMIISESNQKWYALSTSIRLEWPKKITISNILWDSLRIGIGNMNLETEQIFALLPQFNRIMNYSETYQMAITYEVDSTNY